MLIEAKALTQLLSDCVLKTRLEWVGSSNAKTTRHFHTVYSMTAGWRSPIVNLYEFTPRHVIRILHRSQTKRPLATD